MFPSPHKVLFVYSLAVNGLFVGLVLAAEARW